MKKGIRDRESPSRATWDGPEEFVRVKCRGFIQGLLEEEVEALLGRERYERRPVVDPQDGSWNGYGKPRRKCVGVGSSACVGLSACCLVHGLCSRASCAPRTNRALGGWSADARFISV